MKNKKIKRFFYFKKIRKFFGIKKKIKNIFLLEIIFLSLFSFGVVFGALELIISTQKAIKKGSNNSEITFSTGSNIYYINPGDNSTVIGNFFIGDYYSDIFGFFRLDWDLVNKKNNVRIVAATSKCTSGYGYKLGGYAKSNYHGLIDFNYNSNIYVYYCESNNELHGYAYSKHLGFQSFEGIGFEIIPIILIKPDNTSASGIFVNDTTNIDELKGRFLDTLIDTNESIFHMIK